MTACFCFGHSLLRSKLSNSLRGVSVRFTRTASRSSGKSGWWPCRSLLSASQVLLRSDQTCAARTSAPKGASCSANSPMIPLSIGSRARILNASNNTPIASPTKVIEPGVLASKRRHVATLSNRVASRSSGNSGSAPCRSLLSASQVTLRSDQMCAARTSAPDGAGCNGNSPMTPLRIGSRARIRTASCSTYLVPSPTNVRELASLTKGVARLPHS